MEVGGIELVVADGSRGNEADARTFEQGGIAAGASAYDESVGIADGSGRYLSGRQKVSASQLLSLGTRVGDSSIDDKLHLTMEVCGLRAPLTLRR